MDRDQLVLKLSAAMLIIFEFIEVVDDVVPGAAESFSEAMHHLGTAVENACIEEMKATGRIIPRPVLKRDVSYSEASFYEDLARLERALQDIEYRLEPSQAYWIQRANEDLNDGVRAVLVSERRRLAQETEEAEPWSVLDASAE